jgi:hypothetical protein
MINQNHWELDAVLPIEHQIAPQYFTTAPVGVLENFTRLLSRDIFSEGDAQILYDYLMQRQGEFSEAFIEMLHQWLADELKHYEALRRTYHCISGVSFVEMNRLFQERIHEITPIEPVLKDEFTILVTMMFDEIGSVYSYRRDLREYYCHFGLEIQKIGHHLVKDEGIHFSNAAELLLRHHGDRLDQVAPLLREISNLEDRLGKYYKSFFLDHAQEQFRFPHNFNAVIIQVVLARLGLVPYPDSKAVKELWQWVPEGG